MPVQVHPIQPAIDRVKGLRNLIGNTPLYAIDCEFRGRTRRIYAKAEHLKFTGSI